MLSYLDACILFGIKKVLLIFNDQAHVGNIHSVAIEILLDQKYNFCIIAIRSFSPTPHNFVDPYIV